MQIQGHHEKMVSLFTKESQDSPNLLFSRRTSEAQLNPAVPETQHMVKNWWFRQETHLHFSPWCHDPMTQHQRLMSLERTLWSGSKRAPLGGNFGLQAVRLSRLWSPPGCQMSSMISMVNILCQTPSHRPFATFSRSFDNTLQVTVGLTGGYWEQLHSNRLCCRKGYGLVSSVIRLWISASEQSLYQYLI